MVLSHSPLGQDVVSHRNGLPLTFPRSPRASASLPTPLEGRNLKVILTGISSDSHTWNLVFMQLLLEHMGHRVTNLGACVPDGEVISACLGGRPDMLVVSTVNGHGNMDGERLIRALRTHHNLRELPAVIGGKLGIRGLRNQDHAGTLLNAGFSAVFDADNGLASFEVFVERISESKCAPLLGGVS